MGVKLTAIVPKQDLSFDQLAHKRVAVDAFQCLYQFLSSIRQPDGTPLLDDKGHVTSHLMGIWTRFSNLINKRISLVPIFDGVPPDLKGREIESRIERKKAAEKKFESAKDEEDLALMLRYSKQSVRISDGMIDESKKLFQAMGLPVIQAPSESDAQMSFMNKNDDVWACATTDYDVLLHGAPKMLTNLTLSQRKRFYSGKIVKVNPELIELNKVLSSLSLSQDQLVVLAILVGTDYNPDGIHGIGPKKALKLVTKYNKNFNQMFSDVKANFDWKEIFDLFKNMPTTKDYDLSWNEMDVEAVKKILVDKHSFSEERIDNTIKKNEKARPKGQKSLGDF